MTRLELMELAEECSDVLTAMEDDLLQNIAEYLSEGRADIPTAQWKIQQLAALGKLDKANIRTIAEYSGIAADMEEIAMTRAALKAVGEMDEGFGKLAAEGIIDGTAVTMEETALQAAAMYSKQAKDRLNKVNTVMRYFAKNTAAAAVYKAAEIVNKQQHLDTLNKAAGKVIMGAESRQTAVRQCIKEMSERGIPAFVDAGGRQWSPEAYINMDVRTTCSNVAHEAQFTRMDDYEIDLLETSSHPGARPKCSLDQGKIFSRSGKNKKYPAWKTSSYGEPDGILGINCGHFIYPYIEGVSVQRYFPYDKEENDKLYKQKQEQRKLERDVRAAKREVSMLNAAGDKEGAKLAKETVKQKTAKYNEYCEKVGLPRKADRLTVQGYRTKAKDEKKALNILDKPSENDIMNIGRNDILQQAKTRDAKILITDVAVSKANPPVIPHFTQQQNQKFKELHHELLLKSKYENDSNEVAFLFNPNTLKHEFELGDVNSVNIFNNPFALDMFNNSSEKELFLLHNHPTTKIFSYSDIGVLLLHDNIGGITVISNAGKVDVMYKTDNYDFAKAYGALKEIREKYDHKVLSEEEDAEVVRQFLKICDSCGIKFM
ncbi:MAG: phage minor capsid protein [Oscillospiraceae bacterium]